MDFTDDQTMLNKAKSLPIESAEANLIPDVLEIGGESDEAETIEPALTKNKAFVKLSATVVALALVGTGAFAMIRGGNENPSTESVSTPTTSEPIDELSGKNNSSDTKELAEASHLSVSELTQRSIFAKADELYVPFNEAITASSVQDLIDDWAYKYALYVNVGYGDEKTAEALIDDIYSSKWRGFGVNSIEYSESISDYRYLSDNMDRWDFFQFEMDGFESVTANEFIITGTFIKDSTRNGFLDRIEGPFVFKKDTYTIYDQTYTGWRIAKN